MKKLFGTGPAVLASVAGCVLAFSVTTAGAMEDCGPDATLTVVSWGGAYSASQQKAYHDPWMAKCSGIKIVNDDSASEGLAKLRAQIESNNLTWDLVDMEAPQAITACDDGLLEKINADEDLAAAPDGTPASKDFIDGSLVSECFIPQIVYSTTIGYRTDAFGGKKPTSIADLFDMENFPGKRSLEKRPDSNLEWALIADGVSADDVYDVLETEEGIARAFAKLDTIKDQVIWWTKGAVPPQLLADGEVVMASAYNGRLFKAIAEDKQPIEMMWDYQVYQLDGWVVPKGGKNNEQVMKFLKFATDTQRLADQAKYISYGPARNSSAPMVGQHAELGIEMGPHMPTAPENSKNVLVYQIEWWADNRASFDERFNAWLAK